MIHGNGNIIPSSREQVIQSLDPGTVTEIMVREGDMVEKDQTPMKLDDTRSSAVLRESEAKVENLEATVARLRAEAYDAKLSFPDSVSPELHRREIAAYKACRQAMTDTVSGLSQSKAAFDREIAITAPVVAEDVVSEVELLRTHRESTDLATQTSERRNRYRADANNELLQAESELAQSKENVAIRANPVERSQIRVPTRNIVRGIKVTTIDGIVNADEDVMQIVPVDDKLLIETYVRPQDIAFIRTGQPALVKVSAYDYSIYGGLEGKVTLVGADTVSNPIQDRASNLKLDPNRVYYHVLAQTENDSLEDKGGKLMPIIPGMVTAVDIKTGEKTIFQYLIKPITRMKQALDER